MRSYRAAFILFCALVVAGFAGMGIYSATRRLPPQLGPLQRADNLPKLPAQRLSVAGVKNPSLLRADAATLVDDEIIIGVTAFGESRAYVRRAFDRLARRHVVHDQFGSTPVTITHCDRTRFTRVFISKDGKTQCDVRCGGWLEEQEMALLVDGKEYSQSAQDIPLDDLDFVVTTWKEWRETQPNSRVYIGELGAE